jgi:hypothetical protein
MHSEEVGYQCLNPAFTGCGKPMQHVLSWHPKHHVWCNLTIAYVIKHDSWFVLLQTLYCCHLVTT